MAFESHYMSSTHSINSPNAKDVRMIMGTFVSIEINHPHTSYAINAIHEAFAILQKIEQQLSRFIPSSEISQINQKAYQREVIVSEKLFRLLEFCQSLHRDSAAIFDISIGPWMDFWRNCRSDSYRPKQTDINECRSKIGMQHVTLKPSQSSIRFQRPGMILDLGAIGKGYALDQVQELWHKLDITDAVINMGGQILAHHPHPLPYGIIHPLTDNKIIHSVPLQQETLSSSSNSQNTLPQGHLLHPSTGRRSQSNLIGVSVIAEQAMVSDALSTLVFLMGEDEGADLAFKYGAKAIYACFHTPRFWDRQRVNVKDLSL